MVIIYVHKKFAQNMCRPTWPQYQKMLRRITAL